MPPCHQHALHGCARLQGKRCLWTAYAIDQAGGPSKLGYKSWDEIWMHFFVFMPIRNPWDRAGSAFDYMQAHTTNRFGKVCL